MNDYNLFFAQHDIREVFCGVKTMIDFRKKYMSQF